MEANQSFIYLFRVKKTGEIIYVGSCIHIAKRLNEHRRAMRETKRALPIHKYMQENNLKFIDDVEFCVVEYLENISKEELLKKEEEYFYKYRDTLKNTRPAEIRSGEFGIRNKPVYCLNDSKTFYSIRKASEYYNLNRVTIMNHLNKGTTIKTGLVFKYIDSENNVDRKLYKIKCVEDNKSFATYKGCGEFYGFTESMIYNRFRKSDTFKLNNKTFVKCND